jgi:hypothetical protein
MSKSARLPRMEVDSGPPWRSLTGFLRCVRRLIVGGALVACVGCSPPSRPVPQTQPAGPGPRLTLVRLTELRAGHKYRDMTALVVPERAQQVESFLMALDDFLAANGRLGNWLCDHGAVGLAQTIDQSYVADDLRIYAGEDLGIFSRHVELLDAQIDADEATVSYTAGERVPAQRVRMRRVDGTWRYDPGPGYSEHLPVAFHDLARGLDQMLTELETGRISDADLRGSPDVFLEKVQARLRRGVSLLSKAQAAAAGKGE